MCRHGEEPGYEATKCVHCHRKKQTVFKNSNISFIANKQHFWLNCYNVLVWLVFMQSIHIPTCTEVLSLSPISFNKRVFKMLWCVTPEKYYYSLQHTYIYSYYLSFWFSMSLIFVVNFGSHQCKASQSPIPIIRKAMHVACGAVSLNMQRS